MAGYTELFQVGQALMVDGAVRVESANGVSRVIEPNSQIFLDDRIDTGSSGKVSIILNDDQRTQIDLDRLSEMVIDEDVVNLTLPDLDDVSVEVELLSNLLSSQDFTAATASANAVLPEVDDHGTEETEATASLPGLDGSSSTLASSDSSDDGLSSIDEDLDMTNLIPPPDDGA